MGVLNQIYLRDFVFQDAATTGNGNELDLQSLNIELSVYITWSSGVSAGVVKVETSDTSGYAGTWASLASISFTASKTDVVQVSGTLKYVRVRISTGITGGTVTVRGDAN